MAKPRPMVVYGLLDPTSNEIRYVGMTKRSLPKRISQHLTAARSGNRRHVNNWIRTLLKSDLKPKVVVIDTCQTYDALKQAEIETIAYFKSLGSDLCNLTVGGEGCLGYRHSADEVRRMSERQRGKKASDEARKRMADSRKRNVGYHHSDSTRQKIGQALQGRPRPPEAVEATRQFNLGIKRSPETLKIMSESQKGRVFSEESRQKMRDAWKIRKQRAK